MTIKNITLCADDYGQNKTISQGILELLKLKRLSAVSCMTGYDHWPAYAKNLVEIKDKIKQDVDIGLHFDLTNYIAEQGWSFNQFIIRCCLKQIDLKKIEAELNTQLDAFEAELRMPPEFVDGHQHIHVFPHVRAVFIRVLANRYSSADQPPYIRLSTPLIKGHDSLIKALILRALAFGFAQLAQQKQLKFPTQFLGMYKLRPTNYSRLFKKWLQQAEHHSLFMCHPGNLSNDSQDPIKAARVVEFNYFRSDAFLEDLHKYGCRLTKWQR
jgi:predicted glycoside hydrolase/deacetylase ChbG (UPF0249 family)